MIARAVAHITQHSSFPSFANQKRHSKHPFHHTKISTLHQFIFYSELPQEEVHFNEAIFFPGHGLDGSPPRSCFAWSKMCPVTLPLETLLQDQTKNEVSINEDGTVLLHVTYFSSGMLGLFGFSEFFFQGRGSGEPFLPFILSTGPAERNKH